MESGIFSFLHEKIWKPRTAFFLCPGLEFGDFQTRLRCTHWLWAIFFFSFWGRTTSVACSYFLPQTTINSYKTNSTYSLDQVSKSPHVLCVCMCAQFNLLWLQNCVCRTTFNFFFFSLQGSYLWQWVRHRTSLAAIAQISLQPLALTSYVTQWSSAWHSLRFIAGWKDLFWVSFSARGLYCQTALAVE